MENRGGRGSAMNRHWEAIMEGDQGPDLWGAEEELEAEPMDLEEWGTTTADESRGLGGVLDFIRENPIGVTINPASLCPPALAAGGGSSSCSWALLDLKAYIADRPNATTAKNFTRAGHEIQATLCLARPPCVSHLCVHCPALSPADFGTEPAILASCDGFIFFKAGICNASVCFEPALQDFFVYRAPLSRLEGRPSLTRLPHPGPSCNITASMVGLVCCGDEEAEDSGDDYSGGGCTLRPRVIPQQQYVIAVLQSSKGSTQFDFHRFDSREGKWTTEVLQLGPMEPSPGLTFFFHGTHKVITLGGGFMGWVDLCRGILFCNVLVDHPELHYIPLPESADASKGIPEAAANEFRDISVVQGYIKYVEHHTEVQPESCGNGTYISDDWTVTTWTRKFTLNCRQGHWRRKFKCDASKMSGSLPRLLGFEETTPLPPLCRLHTGHPMLGLDEDVVYVLAKVDHRDDKAFVLAVNMKDGMLQAADHFGAERTIGISFTYTQYKTTDSFNIASGKKEKQKKKARVTAWVIEQYEAWD